MFRKNFSGIISFYRISGPDIVFNPEKTGGFITLKSSSEKCKTETKRLKFIKSKIIIMKDLESISKTSINSFQNY
jgi:hypothetical protein